MAIFVYRSAYTYRPYIVSHGDQTELSNYSYYWETLFFSCPLLYTGHHDMLAWPTYYMATWFLVKCRAYRFDAVYCNMQGSFILLQ